MKYIYKNPTENLDGSIDCQIYINREWVPHTKDPAIEYELHDSSDWGDVKSCDQNEKDWYDLKTLAIKSHKYLLDTDWYVIRQLDSGEPMPEDIKAARAKARADIK